MFGLQEAEQAQSQVERFNEETGQSAIFMSIGWGNVAQKAQVAIEGGNPPDLVSLWSQAYTWGPRGLIMPLEDYAERDGWSGQGWADAAYRALSSDGHLWGTGHTLNMWAMHINDSVREEAGIAADAPLTDFEQLDAMADALTTTGDNGDLTRVGFIPFQSDNDLWHWGWAHGAKFYDEDNDKIIADQDERLLQTLEWFASYAKKYDIDKIDRFKSGFGDATMSADDPWYVGKVAMTLDGSWKRSWIPRYAPDLQYTVAKPPSAADVAPGSLVEIGAMFNVPTGAKNPEGGWALAKEFASPRCQIEFGKLVGDIPPNLDAARDPEFLDSYPFNDVFIELADKGGHSWPRIPVLELYQQEMVRAVDQVTHGKAEPQAALTELTQKVQAELDAFRKQTSGA
jgi:multiple sugar transport system substrate-binding protein